MTGPSLLGVERSAQGAAWRLRLDSAGEREAAAIRQGTGLPDLLARVLASRGVTLATVDSYLEPKLRDLLPDPSSLAGMAAATARLLRAITGGERVAIIGDYDVDGACAAALLSGFLLAHGVEARIHIPDRLTEGYGPNVGIVRAMAADGAQLLVTVDCGTTSHDALAEAHARGLDVIVLDHHQAPEQLPPAVAIVNPNRQDDLSGLGSLCAAGVVFVTLVGVARALRLAGLPAGPDLMGSLDIVALATVADVVPLTGLNRAFVRQGLKMMARRGRPGLRALCDVAGLREAPGPYHLGFVLGPRINAGGRIGDAALGARLLLTDDEADATRIAAELDALNRDRQVIEGAMLADAEAQATAVAAGLVGTAGDAPVLVIASESFHPGVVGIVAARLKERYRRPAFVIAAGADGFGTGSARSVAGVDVGRLVRHAVETGLLVKGGGHAMAAGVTLALSRLGEFRAMLATEIGRLLDGDAVPPLGVDGLLSAGGVTPELAAGLERAGPFGQGAPEPVFVFPAHRVRDLRPVGEAHLRARLVASDGASVGAIAFRSVGTALGEALSAAGERPVHIAAALSMDRGRPGGRPEARILDAAFA